MRVSLQATRGLSVGVMRGLGRHQAGPGRGAGAAWRSGAEPGAGRPGLAPCLGHSPGDPGTSSSLSAPPFPGHNADTVPGRAVGTKHVGAGTAPRSAACAGHFYSHFYFRDQSPNSRGSGGCAKEHTHALTHRRGGLSHLTKVS